MRAARIRRIIREHPGIVRESIIFGVSTWAGATTAVAIAYALGIGAGVVAAICVVVILSVMAR